MQGSRVPRVRSQTPVRIWPKDFVCILLGCPDAIRLGLLDGQCFVRGTTQKQKHLGHVMRHEPRDPGLVGPARQFREAFTSAQKSPASTAMKRSRCRLPSRQSGVATDMRCVRRVDDDQPQRTPLRDGFRGVGEIASGPVAHAPVEAMSRRFLPANDGGEVFRPQGKFMRAAEMVSVLDGLSISSKQVD